MNVEVCESDGKGVYLCYVFMAPFQVKFGLGVAYAYPNTKATFYHGIIKIMY